MEKNTSKDPNKLPYIIAVDFDGTLVEDKFPQIGEPIEKVWDAMIVAQNNGAKIILWTSRDHENLEEAVQFCLDRGFHFDAINENLDECKVFWGNDTRKVYANEYWDDKAVPMYSKWFPYTCPEDYLSQREEYFKPEETESAE